MQVAVTALLVAAREFRRVAVRLDETQIKYRLPLDRDVGARGQTGTAERAQQGGGKEASAGSEAVNCLFSLILGCSGYGPRCTTARS